MTFTAPSTPWSSLPLSVVLLLGLGCTSGQGTGNADHTPPKRSASQKQAADRTAESPSTPGEAEVAEAEAPREDVPAAATAEAKAAEAKAEGEAPELRAHTPKGRLRTYVHYRWVDEKRGTVQPWLYTNPEGLTKVPFTVHYAEGGSLGQGGTEPLLSNDGRWLVYLDDKGQPVARRTDDSAQKILVEQERGKEVGFLLSGITPDSKSVLFWQQTPIDMEGELPTPDGFVEGFYLASLETFEVEPVTHLQGFTAWTHDGAYALWLRHESPGNALVATSVATPSTSWTLRTETGPYGIGQPHFVGDAMVYIREGQVVRAPINGGDFAGLSIKGRHAELQWPKLSPNGEYLAYQMTGSIAVAKAEANSQISLLTDCEQRCLFEWYDDLGLYVLEGDVLSSYRRSGGGVEIHRGVAGFAIGG